MELKTSFEVVEPAVRRALPGHDLAPAWVSMWLEQRRFNQPTPAQIDQAIAAYKRRSGETA